MLWRLYGLNRKATITRRSGKIAAEQGCKLKFRCRITSLPGRYILKTRHILNMSSQLYSRYVPTKKKKDPRPPVPSPPPPIAALPPKPAVVDDEPNPKRLKSNAGNQNADDDGDNDGARHTKLMVKRDKSLRKAEKLAKKSAKAKKQDTGEDSIPPPTPKEPRDLVPLPQPEPIPQLPIQSTTSSLPPWLASPIQVSPSSTAQFNDLGIQPGVVAALSSKGFKEAFAVQAAVLPLLLPGPSQQLGDICVSAATGSGKTLAYVLPVIEGLSRHRVTKLRGVIVVPTRELVTQLKDVADICAAAFSTERDRRRVKVGTAIGSGNFKTEQSSLVDQQLTYDPAKYQALMSRLNSKWEGNSDADYEEMFGEEESVPALSDHVPEPNVKVDLLICTPGRLVEHLKSTPGLSLQNLKWLVVDEADKLLDQSFQQWLDVVIGQMPQSTGFGKRDYVRKVILSATMTKDVGQLNSFKLYRPKLVVLEGLSSGVSTAGGQGAQGHVLPPLLVEHAIKVEDESIKPLYLIEILRRQKLLQVTTHVPPSIDDSSDSESDISNDEETPLEKLFLDSVITHGVLIFTKSNESALRLGRLIALLEPNSSSSVATLTSTTRNSTRKAALKSFQSGKLSILVASDLVSRGLDLANLAHVINYDVPSSITSYVHRVGRTARAGKAGQAWTLFTDSEGRWFWNEIGRSSAIERLAASKISRVNIKASHFDAERTKYEEALEELKKETTGSKSR